VSIVPSSGLLLLVLSRLGVFYDVFQIVPRAIDLDQITGSYRATVSLDALA
jgi:hypothetical protein